MPEGGGELWWFSPPPRGSSRGSSSAEGGNGDGGPDDSILPVILMWSWLWVILWVGAIGVLDRCYYPGFALGSMLIVGMFLVITCGGGPLKWIHGGVPWSILVASLIVLVASVSVPERWSGAGAMCRYMP